MTASGAVAAVKPTRLHGTCTRYRLGPAEDGRPGGCRCRPCRDAAAASSRNRRRLIAYGRWEPLLVDAGPARKHAEALSAYGIGRERVAKAAGVSNGLLENLLYGHGGKPPAQKVRRDTAAKILAVRPSLDLLAAKVSVDAAGTRRRLQALMAAGWGRGELARRLGAERTNLGKLLRRDRVSAGTARAVRALYEDLWDAPPDESTPLAARDSARARREARDCGWPRPAAWDDDLIDDPAAPEPDGWQREAFHGGNRAEDIAEDALELLARHYTRAEAAERLDVKRNTLDKAIERARRRAGAQEPACAGETGGRSDAAA